MFNTSKCTSNSNLISLFKTKVIQLMKTIIPMEIKPIKKEGFHCFINMEINESKVLRMVVDTGASQTVLDYKFVKEMKLTDDLESWDEKASGLGTNSMEGNRLKINKIRMEDIILNNYKVGVLDLSHVNNGYDKIEMPHIDGILGGDLLYKYNAIISYQDKTIIMSE